MRIIDRYVARAVLVPAALTLLVLLVLNSAYLFIDEQSNIGEGSYSMLDAVLFVLLSLPQQVFELIPAATLVGAMIGLGELSRRSEIVAMRAAGVSVWRLTVSLAGVGLAVVIFDGIVGEYVAPQSTAIALLNRANARTQHESSLQGSMIWVHDGNRYLRLETSGRRRGISRVTSFEVAPDDSSLTSIGRSENVTVGAEGEWSFNQLSRVQYEGNRLTASAEPSLNLRMRSGNALLEVATEPADRSIEELAKLIRQFQENRQDARAFIFALWSRVAQSISAFWCALLALPFAFGNLRAAKAGVRVFIAVGIGMAFVLIQQLVKSGVVLSSLPPVLLALLPTAALAVVTSVLVLRVR